MEIAAAIPLKIAHRFSWTTSLGRQIPLPGAAPGEESGQKVVSGAGAAGFLWPATYIRCTARIRGGGIAKLRIPN